MPYNVLDVIIIECGPFDARIKPTTIEIPTVKFNPSPLINGTNISEMPAGKTLLIAFITPSKETLIIEQIKPINTMIGITDKTKKNANCPGKIFISGLAIIPYIFFTKSLNFFINSPLIRISKKFKKGKSKKEEINNQFLLLFHALKLSLH